MKNVERPAPSLARWTPRPLPQRTASVGRFVRLEPLSAAKHGEDLYAASSVPDAATRFRWLREEPPSSMAAFKHWLETAEASTDPLYFAAIDRATGKAAGRQAFMRIDTANGVIELGSIYWGPLLSRRPASTEAFYLAARHVFEDLGYRRLEWKCDNDNQASRRAALRYGMKFEGLFRQHMIVKGKNRETAWFSMLDSEWPEAASALQQWLDPANFDGDGQQILRLEEIRTGKGR